MPYIYLLDGSIRTNYNINLKNSIIIFDEAHNVPQACEDIASVELTRKLLILVNIELKKFRQSMFKHYDETIEAGNRQNISLIMKLQSVVSKLSTFLENINLPLEGHYKQLYDGIFWLEND